MDTAVDKTCSLKAPLQQDEIRFGATYIAGYGTQFCFWAPSAQSLELLVNNQPVSLEQQGDGWYRALQPDGKPGDLYGYKINNDLTVPDPASRYQPDDIHGLSMVVDSNAFHWTDSQWTGRLWQEAIIYELHIGTFTPEGTFLAAIEKLDQLIDLGITAIELMPLSDFPGNRNWGYDGVLPYAPDASYGTPDELKQLIDIAHQKGLMVFLDVVYNHFGPEGNYLGLYAKPFFNEAYHTPWGAAINFDADGSEVVRQFFIQNTLYWLNEFHFDGLRFDAVHAIYDQSHPSFLESLAQAVHDGPGQHRHIHLILENDHNQATLLEYPSEGQPKYYSAQWNDDIHHVLHVLASGETQGYYEDYANCPIEHLERCLTEGFDFQGQESPYRDGAKRGEVSKNLPSISFVSFIQNHDQVGNRAFGDRLTDFAKPESARLAVALYLLAPQIPMLFMGEEWAAPEPFPFFCDFGPELGPLVTEGRRKEFAKFPAFNNPEHQARIPDPQKETTFSSAKLDWSKLTQPNHQEWLAFYKHLIALRCQHIIPLLKQNKKPITSAHRLSDLATVITWKYDTTVFQAWINFSEQPVTTPDEIAFTGSAVIFSSADTLAEAITTHRQLPPQSILWSVVN